MSKIEIDPHSGVKTTGHEWDGIRELDNKTPTWITFLFSATAIWAIVYAVFYPSIPSFSGHTKGILNYSARVEVERDIARARAEQSVFYDKLDSSSVEEILADSNLRAFALRGGEVAFKENCVACHATGGVGRTGYPNLADDDWLWGGSISQITFTIKKGIRANENKDTRVGDMTAFAPDILSERDLEATIQYVRNIAGLTHDGSLIESGKIIFDENCKSCHQEGGKGDITQGAPALNDAIWLKSNGEVAAIELQTRKPTQGQMPTWEGRLSDTTIKMLVSYVYSLSHSN